MKTLKRINPSDEQLTIIKRVRAGVELVRGAAGSGKTTTAVMKLKMFLLWFRSQRRRDGNSEPIRALVLTYNKTLRGYVDELVAENIQSSDISITVDTFSRWAYQSLQKRNICNDEAIKGYAILGLPNVNLPLEFATAEAIYAMGRFLPENIEEYLTCRRDGRGATPRVDRQTRQAILDHIIRPYQAWKNINGVSDWNDLAVELVTSKIHDYEIIIVDETQDFTANYIRAILNQLSANGVATLVIDTAQRIYTGGFTWSEVGLTIRPENSHRLSVNYRNTPEIAQLAASLLSCVSLDDDGTPPLLDEMSGGDKPKIIKGYFRDQVSWALQYIEKNVDLSVDSVAFLHPKGWFDFLKKRLNSAGVDYIEITGLSDWPEDEVNVALSTLHSAKGLDFDYVFLIGLDKKGFPEGDYELGDDRFEHACRLLSMAIARARKGVVIGYKEGEQPELLARFDPSYYDEVVL